MSIFEFFIQICKGEGTSIPNLMEKKCEIIGAKDRYNIITGNKKYLLVTDITNDSIRILIRFEGSYKTKSKASKITSQFLSILMKDYNWKEYLCDNSNKFFEVRIVKEMNLDECRGYIKKLDRKIKEYNSEGDSKRLLSLEGDKNETQGAVLLNPADEAIKKIEAMVGYDNFKKEIREVVKYVELNNKLNKDNIPNPTPVFPFHYIFIGKKGVDHYKAAVLMSELFYHLGIIKNKKEVRIDVAKHVENYSGVNLDSLVNPKKVGVVFLECITEVSDDHFKKALEKLVQKMKEHRGSLIYVISYYEDKKREARFNELNIALKKDINFRTIKFPFYNDDELICMINKSAKEKQYHISDEAAGIIAGNIKYTSQSKCTDLEYEFERIIERAIVDKKFRTIFDNDMDNSFNLDEFAVLKLDDFRFLTCDEISQDKDGSLLIELNEMIGLSEVKERIKQIIDFVKVRIKKREIGIPDRKICMHMEFVGNPGTGKTTVARIIGGIFKKLGYLSSGHFVEVIRENLIGPYIGQTLPKVKKAFEEAMGGILFIDEAYSLNANSENDYGVEALSYIVKAMEEFKDDLIIILAGYPEEMDKMVAINPGMRDRIAFKIDFPDYNEEELIHIFCKMCKDNFYNLNNEAELEIHNFIKEICKSKVKNFGNARLIRRIFERVELYQNKRICLSSAFDKEEIQLIKKEDILSLYNDKEISVLLKGQKAKGNIGFVFKN